MSHLTFNEIEEYLDGRATDAASHLVGCERCAREAAFQARVTRALATIDSTEPSPAFVRHLDRSVLQFSIRELALTRPGRAEARYEAWTAAATLLAAVLLLVFMFQTVIAFEDGGALEFVSLYASNPALLFSYPTESFNALFEALPLVELILTIGLGIIALVLARQFLSVRSAARHSQG